METILQEVTPAILQLVSAVVIALVGVATQQVKRFYEEKKIGEKLSNYDYLAEIAVHAAEQIFEKEKGAEKLAYAKDHFVKSANERGLDIHTSDVEMFIESAVKRMKEEWHTVSREDDGYTTNVDQEQIKG